jgi:hypothetical protein
MPEHVAEAILKVRARKPEERLSSIWAFVGELRKDA